jgi:DHA3 family macrolide efflux protein-like MFS transporter
MSGQVHGRLGGFLTLWSGQAASLLGTQAVQFALVWWLTVRTGSAAILATATLMALAPGAILGPLIGTLVDRWSRQAILLVSDASLAAAAAGLAVLFWLDAARPSHVLALVLLRGVGEAFHGTSMLASTTLMVPERHLARIQGLNQALQGGLLVVAPPLGALLYGALPMAGVMAIDVATAALAILPLLFVRVPQPERAATSTGRESTVWTETAEGLRYLAARQGHLALLGIAALINLFLTPAFALLPLLVHDQGGSAARMGWIASSFGIGMAGGGVLLGIWGGFRRRILTALAGLLGVGLSVLAVAGLPASSAWFPVALLAVGATATLANGPILAILQATVAPDYQGRVFTLYGSLATAAAPVGLLLAAPLAERFGVEAWLFTGGVLTLGLGALAFTIRAILDIESPAVPAPNALRVEPASREPRERP